MNRKTEWTTYEGISKPLEELEDSHLANIMLHVHNNEYAGADEIMKVCVEILKERGITADFVNMAQMPHKNKDGLWACWDYKTNQPKLLQEAK